MKTKKWFYSVLVLGMIIFLGILGCSGKKKGFLPLLAIAAMDDDGSSGQTNDEDLLSSSSQAETASSGSQSLAIGSYTANIPNGIVVNGEASGDFTGITFYAGNGYEATGFLSTVPDGGNTNSTDLGATLISQMLANGNINTANVVSANTINNADGNTTLYQIAVNTNTAMTVSELGNVLAQQLGLSTEDILITQSNEIASNDFRLVMQVTFSNTTEEVIGIGISTENNFINNEAVLVTFFDGTNIVGSTSETLSKTDGFVAKTDPKVDIVWVVDNSGSMKEEQGAVISNAGEFFNQLSNKHLDFRLAAITTDNEKIVFPGNSKIPPRTGWTSASDGSQAFVNNVNAGLKGSGTESGIHFAEKAINTGTVVPREGASLVFVMLSDEGDHYACYHGGSVQNAADPCNGGTDFDPNNNVFKANGYKVYAIIGLNSSGQAAKCTGSGTSATTINNQWPGYYNLAQATGGMAGTICSNDYSQLLNSITNQAAAAASSYVLSHIPMSSTVVVKKNGEVVPKDSNNGWMYNSSNNSIVFSGTSFPKVGDIILVNYEYSSESQAAYGEKSSLFAYLSANNSARLWIALLIVISGISISILLKRKTLFQTKT